MNIFLIGSADIDIYNNTKLLTFKKKQFTYKQFLIIQLQLKYITKMKGRSYSKDAMCVKVIFITVKSYDK